MFNKKNKYKQTNEDDTWLTKTWNTPRGRASIKLAFYGLFVLVIFITIIFSADKRPTVYKSTYNVKTVSKDFNEKIKELKANNYAFNYNLNIASNHILIYGQKKLNLETGYKENNQGIIRYLKENDKIYKIGIDNEKEEMPDLFSDINSNYLNINYLLELINNQTPIEEDNKKIYNLENNIAIEIESDSQNITKITIKENENTYELDFSEIGKIEKIDLETK